MIEYVLLATLLAGVSVLAIGNVGANANELFDTVNNALREGKSPGPGPIPPDSPDDRPAYAMIYSDGSMILQRGNEPDTSKTLVAEYSDIETTGNAGPYAWLDYMSDIKTVIAKDVIKPTDMEAWFWQFSNCTSMDLSKIDTSEVTTFYNTFSSCSNLVSLNIGTWNVEKATTMDQMFLGCGKITSFDIENWKIRNVKDFHQMFNGCDSITSIDLEIADTGENASIQLMFGYCSKLKNLDLSNWNTSKISDMSNFLYGTSLETLDLSSFDTSNVTNMNGMMGIESKFRTIKVGDKFSVCDNNGNQLICFPIPLNESSVPGYWKAQSDGKIYDDPMTIPNNKADVYTATWN